MAFRIVTALCVLVLLYAGFEWARMAWIARDAHTPEAAFLIAQDGKDPALDMFIDYRCGNCQSFYKAVDDLRALHPGLRFTIRPVAWIDKRSEQLARLALAAGLEGKFAELNAAFLERNGDIPESFIRETASLYGMDYDELVKKSQGADVTALLLDEEDDAAELGATTVPSLLTGPVYYVPPAGSLDTFSVSDLVPVLEQARQTR